jgi:hypothetical protein
MIVDFNKETITRFLFQEDIDEFIILQMHNKEFLINIKTQNKNNIAIITDNWEDLVKEFY